MVWRISDVMIGIVTGAICCVAAAFYEVIIGALRIFSFGHLGNAFSVKFFWLAALGAVVGGIVGWLMGALKPRERERVR